MKRYSFIIGLGMAAFTLLGSVPSLFASVLVPQTPLDPKTLTKFLDPLPAPPVIDATGGAYNSTSTPLVITMEELQQQLLPSNFTAGPFGGKTTVWGYGAPRLGIPAATPGPTLVAQRNVPVYVNYLNNLLNPTLQQYITIDQTLHWADPLKAACMGKMLDCTATPNDVCCTPYQGPVPTAVHLHGGEVESASDGGPDAWFTPDPTIKGSGWVSDTVHYPNSQEATTMFYHDHALGSTRINVFSGLAAFYLLRDPAKEPSSLPGGSYEVGLAIQDRMFDTNGQLLFPDIGGNPAEHPFWVPEFFGDTIMVNGKVWPYLNVEQRRYRFHVLNGSNARFYNLLLSNRFPIWVIGSDGGYLPAPKKLNTLTIAPGERYDIIIDFTAAPVGTRIVLQNNARAPFPFGAPVDLATTGQVMQFRVVPRVGADTSVNPASNPNLRPNNTMVDIKPAAAAAPSSAVPIRRLTLNEHLSPIGAPLEVLLNNSKYMAAVTENPRIGSTEVWEITNMTMDAHPIHLHLVQFQLLNRQKFDTVGYDAVYNAAFPSGIYEPAAGPPQPYGNCSAAPFTCGGNPDISPYLLFGPRLPDSREVGWKDTFVMYPGEVTRVVVRWAPQDIPYGAVAAGNNLFPFTPTLPQGSTDPKTGLLTGPGYVWHCHIIDHEDNEMMRPYTVSP